MLLLRFFLGILCGTTVAAASNLPLLSGTLRTFQVHACDGGELRIECPPDTLVSISLAQYGRRHQLCTPTAPSTAHCLPSSRALTTVEESCRERRTCRLRTSPQTFGEDPCPGLTKYAEVAFKCRPSVFSNKVVCEGDRLRLRCLGNLRIVIYSAAFGATHYGAPECPQPQGEGIIEDCQVSYATETVMSSCHGRRKCSVGADIGTFGRPGCPHDARLFLKVVHTCVPKEILKDLDLGGSEENKELEDDYMVEEPTAVPPSGGSTAKTDMQSDSGEESGGGQVTGGGKVVGFLSEWASAYNFIRENKEKFVLYLTLSLGLLLVAAALTTRCYLRRRHRMRRRKHPVPPAQDAIEGIPSGTLRDPHSNCYLYS